MPVEMLVLMGVSGAGKNHFIENNMPRPNMVISADDFFMKDGKYEFDPKLLSKAHADCFRKTVAYLKGALDLREAGGDDVKMVVNNTNTSIAELAPYMAAAGAYDANARVLCFRIDPKIAATRNTHGTSLATIEKMAERIEKTLKDLPPWWEREVLQWDPVTAAYRLS